MQKEEYLIKNACYSVTKSYLCKQNNKRSFFSSKQRHKAFRSFLNRYLFSYINTVTSLFSDRYIFIIILTYLFVLKEGISHSNHSTFSWCFKFSNRIII